MKFEYAMIKKKVVNREQSQCDCLSFSWLIALQLIWINKSWLDLWILKKKKIGPFNWWPNNNLGGVVWFP